MTHYVYNSELEPPAPFVPVLLRNAVTGAERNDLTAQLDTGACRTVLPLSVAESLDLVPLGPVTVTGFGGSAIEVPVYAVLLGIDSLPSHLIEVLAHPDEPWVLIGRDILNNYRLVLDGPARKLEIG